MEPSQTKKPKGNIQNANENFVKTLGYTKESELVGSHHSMFCEPAYTNSREYQKFWEDLGKGLLQQGKFKRISKNGSEVWIQAAYTPVTDSEGNVVSVMKIASDITTEVNNQNNIIKSKP